MIGLVTGFTESEISDPVGGQQDLLAGWPIV